MGIMQAGKKSDSDSHYELCISEVKFVLFFFSCHVQIENKELRDLLAISKSSLYTSREEANQPTATTPSTTSTEATTTTTTATTTMPQEENLHPVTNE